MTQLVLFSVRVHFPKRPIAALPIPLEASLNIVIRRGATGISQFNFLRPLYGNGRANVSEALMQRDSIEESLFIMSL